MKELPESKREGLVNFTDSRQRAWPKEVERAHFDLCVAFPYPGKGGGLLWPEGQITKLPKSSQETEVPDGREVSLYPASGIFLCADGQHKAYAPLNPH